MNLSEPIESITASMDAATREAYAGIKKGASFSETITLYLSFIDYAKQKNEHSPIYADAAEMLALTLKAKLPDGIDTDKIAAAVGAEALESWRISRAAYTIAEKQTKELLTTASSEDDFADKLDTILAEAKDRELAAYLKMSNPNP